MLLLKLVRFATDPCRWFGNRKVTIMIPSFLRDMSDLLHVEEDVSDLRDCQLKWILQIKLETRLVVWLYIDLTLTEFFANGQAPHSWKLVENRMQVCGSDRIVFKRYSSDIAYCFKSPTVAYLYAYRMTVLWQTWVPALSLCDPWPPGCHRSMPISDKFENFNVRNGQEGRTA